MKVEIDIRQFGDYGLLFIALCDGLKIQDHAGIKAAGERIAQLAKQNENELKSNEAGVVKP